MSSRHSTAHHRNAWPLAPTLTAPMSERALRVSLGLAVLALIVVLAALAPLVGA